MFAAIDLSQQVARYSIPSWYPTVAAIWFVILGIACLIGFALHYRFLRILRDRFPKTWIGLGSPSMFQNNSIANGRLTSQFLRSRAYETTGDLEFIRFCTGYRIFRRAYTIYFAAGLLLLWIPFVIFGQHHRNAS